MVTCTCDPRAHCSRGRFLFLLIFRFVWANKAKIGTTSDRSLNRESTIPTLIYDQSLSCIQLNWNLPKMFWAKLHVWTQFVQASGMVHVIKDMNHFGNIVYLLSYLQFQFLTAEETPEEPPSVTDSSTLRHFAREAEVNNDWLCDNYFVTLYSRRTFCLFVVF